MILFLISIIAGVITVLAPCTLPLAPIIIGGSLEPGGHPKRRAVTVILSLGVSIIAFTFILKVSTAFINVPENFWHTLSGGIIIIVGVLMLAPTLWEKVAHKLYFSSNRWLASGYKRDSIWGDIIVGAALGPVFSSCSPTYFLVLASVLPSSPLLGFLDLLGYTTGLSAALLLVALLGQRLLRYLGIASDPNGTIKRVIGIIFVLIGIAIVFSYDQRAESWLLNSSFDVSKVEGYLLELKH